jgi:two-component system response regulator LytT
MISEKLQILIVEDELLIAAMLHDILVDLNYEVVAKAKNFDSAFLSLKENPNINFVFLDINLSEQKTGFDVATKLNKNYKIPFIFLTSYSDVKTIQTAVAFKPQAYLIKPFTKSDLYVTLELYKSRNFASEKTIEIKDGHFSLNLKHSEILWIKSENIYLEIKTANKIYLVRNSLEKFLEKLEDDDFMRIHRSYAVNINHIKAVNRLHIIVENQKLPISRMHHEALVAKFSN